MAGEYSRANTIDFNYLLPGHRYWFQIRHHVKGQPFHLGWVESSDKVECTAPAAAHSDSTKLSVSQPYEDTKLRIDPVLEAGKSTNDTWTSVAMIRKAHGESADGMVEHNAANVWGEFDWINGHGTGEGKCVLSMYNVHIKKAELAKEDHITAPWDKIGFANYMSCDAVNGGTANPCGSTGHGNCSYQCHPIHPPDCRWLMLHPKACKTAEKHSSVSKVRPGMGVQNIPTGRIAPIRKYFAAKLYSTPKAAGPGYAENWYMDRRYRNIECKRGMTPISIWQAFKKAPFKDWHSDVSAFEGLEEQVIV